MASLVVLDFLHTLGEGSVDAGGIRRVVWPKLHRGPLVECRVL